MIMVKSNRGEEITQNMIFQNSLGGRVDEKKAN